MTENLKVLRWAVKISKDATFEEMQDTIRTATGNTAFQLSREQFDHFKALDPVERERRETMIQLLGPLYDEYAEREDAEALKRMLLGREDWTGR